MPFKSIPIKPHERLKVANLGRLITKLANLKGPLTDEQVMEMLGAADQVEWLAGERRDWSRGKERDDD